MNYGEMLATDDFAARKLVHRGADVAEIDFPGLQELYYL